MAGTVELRAHAKSSRVRDSCLALVELRWSTGPLRSTIPGSAPASARSTMGRADCPNHVLGSVPSLLSSNPEDMQSWSPAFVLMYMWLRPHAPSTVMCIEMRNYDGIGKESQRNYQGVVEELQRFKRTSPCPPVAVVAVVAVAVAMLMAVVVARGGAERTAHNYICIYIYAHTYVHVYMYIYIYIIWSRAPEWTGKPPPSSLLWCALVGLIGNSPPSFPPCGVGFGGVDSVLGSLGGVESFQSGVS